MFKHTPKLTVHDMSRTNALTTQAEKDAEEAIEAGGSVPVTVTPVPKPVTKKEQDNVHEKDKGVEIIADLQVFVKPV